MNSTDKRIPYDVSRVNKNQNQKLISFRSVKISRKQNSKTKRHKPLILLRIRRRGIQNYTLINLPLVVIFPCRKHPRTLFRVHFNQIHRLLYRHLQPETKKPSRNPYTHATVTMKISLNFAPSFFYFFVSPTLKYFLHDIT